jgi:L-rhamnose-H+ transport protein
MDTILGIVLVTLAGIGTGSIAWPMKKMRKLQFEHYWFVGMLVALVIVPWLVVLTQVQNPFQAYSEVGIKPLIISNLLAAGWGIANVIYGVCVIRIGAALTGAILTALGLSVGVTLPLIFKGSGLFNQAPDINSKAGIAIMTGVAVIIIGVVLVSIAGFGREKALQNAEEQTRQKQASGGFLGGLILVTIAGVLSCGISLSFVYSQGPILEIMKVHGASETTANIAVWAGGLLGGALINLIYPAYIMTRNKSWNLLTQCWGDVGLGAIIGLQFIIGVIMMGRGMLMLGTLGASVGFGIQQALQIMGNQGVGFFSGEWKGVTGKPRNFMYAALSVILFAVIILAYSNTLK